MAPERHAIVALILTLVLVAPVFAAESTETLEPVPEATEALDRPGFLEVPIEELPPRLQAIREILDRQDAKLAELTTRYEAATSDAVALEVQREMHELKGSTEILLLEAQLELAREAGETGKVVEIEEILRHIESREGVLPGVDRPARGQ